MDIVASPAVANPAETRPSLSQEVEKEAGLVPPRGIEVEDDTEHPSELNRPPLLKHVYVASYPSLPCLTNVCSSSPAYDSPLRHHRRVPSTPKQVKVGLFWTAHDQCPDIL